MNSKFLVRTLAVVLVILGAGFAWYYRSTSSISADTQLSESAAAKYEEWAKAQKLMEVEFVVSAPSETPADQSIYLSGSAPTLGNWRADGVRLERGADGMHRAKVELLSGIEHAYKVTRKTWGTVEKDDKGSELANRTFRLEEPKTIEVKVASWADGGKTIPGRHTISSNAFTESKFASKLLGNERDIVVLLPPGYAAAPEKRYPVLYLQDGNNLFDEYTSYQGIEWQVDETSEQLAAGGKIQPAIIVGVFNSEQRTEEFTPPGGEPAGRADQYATFLVDEVKPFIDSKYRTNPDAANTAIGGASMGGLVSLYTVAQKPNVFGNVILFTPWLRTAEKDWVAEWGDMSFIKGKRVWISMGDKPGHNYPGETCAADAQALVKKLEAAGLKQGNDMTFVNEAGGEHNEAAWQKSVAPALTWLYGK